jgi:hypothetical protein
MIQPSHKIRPKILFVRPYVAYAAVFCTAMLLSWPAWRHGFPTNTHDGLYHAMWAKSFADQFLAGDLYPRWLLNLNGGLGSPVFFYYPPLPYWIVSLFRLLLPAKATAWHALGLSSSLGLAFSGLFMLLWLRRLTSLWPAAAAAVLYMAMPYHLHTDLFIRGAYAEFWAFAWMPLILWAVHLIHDRHRYGLPMLSFAYALLIVTHLPAALIFSWIPPVYAAILNGKEKRYHIFGRTLFAIAIGAGLGAVYIIPVLMMHQHISISEFTHSPYEYVRWFLASNSSWKNPRNIRLFKKALFLLMLSIIIAGFSAFTLICSSKEKSLRRLSYFWLTVLGFAAAMMFPFSRPIWHILPPLQMIQFPWRFCLLLCLAAAALSALGLESLRGLQKDFRNHELKMLKNPSIWKIGCPLLILGLCILYWGFITVKIVHAKYPQQNSIGDDALSVMTDALEYRPHWVMISREQVIARYATNQPDRHKADFHEGVGSISVVAWRPRHLVLNVRADTNSVLLIHQFYFAGWEAKWNGKPVAVMPSVPEGLLRIDLHPGSGILELNLTAARAEHLGLLISCLSLLILITGLFPHRIIVDRISYSVSGLQTRKNI